MSLLEFLNDFLDNLLQIFATHTSSSTSPAEGLTTPSMLPEGTPTPGMAPEETAIPRRFLLEFINEFFDRLLQNIGSNTTSTTDVPPSQSVFTEGTPTANVSAKNIQTPNITLDEFVNWISHHL